MSRQSGQPGDSAKDGAKGDSWLSALPRGSGKLQEYLTTKAQSPKRSYSGTEARVPRRTLGLSGSVSSQREKFQALNSSGSDAGRKKAPSFEKELSDVTCRHGDRLSLECRVAGSPSPKVTWYKDGEQIKYHKDYRISQTGHIAKLNIICASESDIGQFSCCASNSEGEATTLCYLTVEGDDSATIGDERSIRSRSTVSPRSRYQEQDEAYTRHDGAKSSVSERLQEDTGAKISRSELVIPVARGSVRKEDDLNVSDPNLPSIKTLDDQELRVNKEVELVINTKGKVITPLSTRVTTNKMMSSLDMKQDDNNNTGPVKNERSEVMIFPEVGETDTDSSESRKIELVTPSYDSNDEVRVSRRVESVVTSHRSLGDGADPHETKTSHITVSSMRARNGVHEKTHFTARVDDDDGKVYNADSKDYSSRLRGTSADSDQLERALGSVASDLRGNYDKSDSSNTSEERHRSSLKLSSIDTNTRSLTAPKGLRNRFQETDKAGKDMKKDDAPKRLDPLRLRDSGDIRSRSQKFEVNLKKTSDRTAKDDKPKNELKEARFSLKKTSSPRTPEVKSDGIASWQRKKFEVDSKDSQASTSSTSRFVPKSKGLSALRGEISQPSEFREKTRTTQVTRRTEYTEKSTDDGTDKTTRIEQKETEVIEHKGGESSSNEDEPPPAIPQATFPGQTSSLEQPESDDNLDTETQNLKDRNAIDAEESHVEKIEESHVIVTTENPEEPQEDTKASLRKARLARMAEILAKAEESDSFWDPPSSKAKESKEVKEANETKSRRIEDDQDRQERDELRERREQEKEEKRRLEEERIQELERKRQERKKQEEERKKLEQEKKMQDVDRKKQEDEDFIKLAEQRREERRKKREEERRLLEEERIQREEEQRRLEEEKLQNEQELKQDKLRREEEQLQREEERLRKEEERLRREEEERLEEERRLEEELRIQEEERRAEEERLAEQERLEAELERERLEEEKRAEELRKKEQRAEELRKEEQKAEELRKEEQKAEELRKEELRKEQELQEEAKKKEEEEKKREEKQREEQVEAEKSTIQNISDLMFTADPNLTNGVSGGDMSERSRRYTRESKPSFIIKPRRQFVDEGQVAKFKASFDGEPQPTVRWAYKNSPISDTSKYKIYEKNDFHFLEVNDVAEEDKGTYSITISNKLGSESMSAELEVFVKSKLTRSKKTAQPPKFEKELTDTVVKDGDRVTLECTVTGTPEPTVTWFFNKKLLKTSNDITQTYNGRRSKLTFVEVFPDDKGVYECVATNTGGEVKSSCMLTVEGLTARTDASFKNGEDKPEVVQDVGPVFTKMLESLTVQDGAMVSLECHVTGSPQPRVIWYKAGVQVKASEDFIMTYDGSLARLLIQEVYPEDEGEYTCVAENAASDARCKCKLIVKVPEQGKEEAPPTLRTAPPPKTAPKPAARKSSDTTPVGGKPPKVIKRLKDMTVTDGDRVELVVEVDGSEPIDVVWLHGEKEIKKTSAVYDLFDEGMTRRLVVPEVYPEDAGLYVCEVYNEFGDAETNMTLSINDREVANKDRSQNNSKNGAEDLEDGEDDEFYAPEFIRKPRSVNVEEGNCARFQCQIDAYPPPTVCWEKDTKILENGGRFRISEDGEMFTFEIPHTLATDAGRYVVIATNSLGTEKYSVSLMVKEIESTEVTDFRGVLKTSRQKSQSYGNADIEVDQVDFRKVLQSGTPTSTKARTGQIEADYKVQPDAEQVDFRKVLTRHVKTKERPIVKKELRDAQAKEGEAVKMECIIIGTPMPEIRWYHGKKEVKESKYFKMSYERGYAILLMSEVYKEDEGEYLCMAVNTAGTVHSSCDLKVIDRGEDGPRERRRVDPSAMEPPLIEDLQPDNLHILRGTTAQLKAKVAGEPRPNVVWTHGKNPVSTGGRLKIDVVRDTTTLTILDAQPDDSGIYTLSVDNELGCDTCSSSLTVEDKPNPPAGQPAASNITGTSLTLSWYGPSFDGGSPVSDYRVEILKVGEVDWKTLTSNCKYTSFQVRNLEKNTEYLFRVSAANKHGFSDPGKISEVVVTIDRRRSSTKLDELAFEPREVTISDRVYKDHYVLSDEIGKGKFGNVCLCIEKSTGRELATKFIRIKATERDQARQEVNIMNQLHHSKLLMLYDAFQTPREVILVMEHIAGGELFERIVDDDYILTERECIHFMRQIIDGVGFMHEKNILHLDLKPENILCVTRNSNEIKIIDFGLARKFDPKKSFRVMFGTPEFVAPEVVNYDQISYATDMWSVGVICYLLISGISPFLGENDAETLSNVTAAQFDFEDKSFDPVTPDAKAFIEGMLTKNMRRRLTATKALAQAWLAQDVKFMKAKRLSTEKHKRFLARRRWQKTGNAIRALGRMTQLQKAFKHGDSSFSNSSTTGSVTSTQESVLENEECFTENEELIRTAVTTE